MAPSWDSVAPLRLCLLGTLLLAGAVKSQSNYTELLSNLSHTAVGNGWPRDQEMQESPVFPTKFTEIMEERTPKDATMNTTLLDNELNRIREDHNSTVVMEDEEEFQDWEDELLPGRCLEDLLHNASHEYCGHDFYMKMINVSQEKWCSLKEVIRPYHEMTECLERLSTLVGCFFPNPIIQDLFLEIHTHFFKTCSWADLEDELVFTDPPLAVVLTLTLLPVCLIPALVYMAIRKNQEQKSINQHLFREPFTALQVTKVPYSENKNEYKFI